MYQQYLNIVPAQYTGKEIEVESTLQLKNSHEAKIFYELVKNRLLDVNYWHNLAGLFSAVFTLVDAKGVEVDRSVVKGDFIKIDIPGPGSGEGGGYDWVRVEEKNENEEENLQFTGFTVRPSYNPWGNKQAIAHFYTVEATSSFIAIRNNTEIKAMIFDRNLRANDVAETVTDKLRDGAVGISAIGGFSKMQWQNLANGLIKQH